MLIYYMYCNLSIRTNILNIYGIVMVVVMVVVWFIQTPCFMFNDAIFFDPIPIIYIYGEHCFVHACMQNILIYISIYLFHHKYGGILVKLCILLSWFLLFMAQQLVSLTRQLWANFKCL